MRSSLLRTAITAGCIVALSSVADAQLASTAEMPSERAPSLMTPVVAMPPVVTTPTLDPTRVRQPTVVAPAAKVPDLLASELETGNASRVNDDVASVMRRREAFSRPQVLMITGGALLLTGLLVDGDASSILIIAGAGIGGYGLYLHLQSPDARLVR